MSPIGRVLACVGLALQIILLLYFCTRAYQIRLKAVTTYGPIIHEFDPWFNFRATEYLAANGWKKFFHWYDYMSWYPLGRPIGTTIYPGMQITAVQIWETLKYVPKHTWKVPSIVRLVLPFAANRLKFGPMSLNDVCVYIPAWFGSIATFLLAMLTWEVSGSRTAAVAAAGIMAIIPAHTMRSVAGGYDNESIAVSAIVLVFWLWCRAVRSPKSWPIGALAGLAYVYMVAAWGGYIFVINMVGLHAALLVPLGRFNSGVHKAYSLFFIIGTAGAVQVPVVGWTPLKSMEQIMPLLTFLGYQALVVADIVRMRGKEKLNRLQFFQQHIRQIAMVGLGLLVLFFLLMSTGFFGPLSSRIRGLFVRHTRTGNPLVDSVAEHQPATPEAYKQYLHNAQGLAWLGFLMCLVTRSNAKYFVLIYAFVAYYFSLKMVRLIIICGPIASLLAGTCIGYTLEWLYGQIMEYLEEGPGEAVEAETPQQVTQKAGKAGKGKKGKTSRGGGSTEVVHVSELNTTDWILETLGLRKPRDEFLAKTFNPQTRMTRAVVAMVVLALLAERSRGPWAQFAMHSEQVAEGMSSPQIVFKSRMQNGEVVIIDDYRAAYLWLKENTPEDARVMAWWDYGYQITGVANRTSIADGNTWNHEHIATLARCLVSPEKRAHNIIRHLADYVLIWAGGGGDDLAKSVHMARIGTSVYDDICPNDPTCVQFGFEQGGAPTPMMAKSLLYTLHGHNQQPGVRANPKLFQDVHKSRHGLVRIFKVLNVSEESKIWGADPANRKCDAPGSWYCEGAYPPAMQKVIQKRKDFVQLEDFNKKGGQKSAYSKYVEEQNRR